MKKVKKLINARVLVFTLIFVLLTPYLSMFLPQIEDSKVYAAQIKEEDAYKGVALFLLLSLMTKYLGGESEPEPESDSQIKDMASDDLRLLAKVIHAEARGEPYRGQVAVGAVVLNRVRSSNFPNSVRGVIYQKKQFTSVKNGQINLTPNATAFKAAKAALNGEDPSLGALYFYNPKKAKTLWWLSTRDRTVKIGDHVFAK